MIFIFFLFSNNIWSHYILAPGHRAAWYQTKPFWVTIHFPRRAATKSWTCAAFLVNPAKSSVAFTKMNCRERIDSTSTRAIIRRWKVRTLTLRTYRNASTKEALLVCLKLWPVFTWTSKIIGGSFWIITRQMYKTTKATSTCMSFSLTRRRGWCSFWLMFTPPNCEALSQRAALRATE